MRNIDRFSRPQNTFKVNWIMPYFQSYLHFRLYLYNFSSQTYWKRGLILWLKSRHVGFGRHWFRFRFVRITCDFLAKAEIGLEDETISHFKASFLSRNLNATIRTFKFYLISPGFYWVFMNLPTAVKAFQVRPSACKARSLNAMKTFF